MRRDILFVIMLFVTSNAMASGAEKLTQYSVRFDSAKIVYEIPRPKSFHRTPKAALALKKNTYEDVFSAFYERSMFPDVPLYEVAATLVRTTHEWVPSRKLDLEELVKFYANEPLLRIGLKDPPAEMRSVETIGENSWMVIKTYKAGGKNVLNSVICTRPVASDYVIHFRLNFWESNKDAEWRRKRVPLLIDIVRSVKIEGK
jgi:hypothetical protein